VFCATDSFGVLSCAAHISSRAVLGQLGWSFLQRGTARRWGSFPECPLGPAPGLRKPASAGRAHQRHQTADNGDHANAPCSCVTPFLLAVNHQEGSLPLSGYAANRRRVRRLRRLKTMEWVDTHHDVGPAAAGGTPCRPASQRAVPPNAPGLERAGRSRYRRLVFRPVVGEKRPDRVVQTFGGNGLLRASRTGCRPDARGCPWAPRVGELARFRSSISNRGAWAAL
jgi:hypothetical protein